MVTNKTKKNRAMRGSRTHGWGSPKKHRGKGSRGGVGKSGMGKRGQHKMSLLNSLGIKNLGSHGFIRPSAVVTKVKAINLNAIDANINKWLTKKIAVEEKGVVSVDLSKIGFNKVLGTGRLSRKMIIKADKFSEGAKKKIEAAGGKADGEVVAEKIDAPNTEEKTEAKPKTAASSKEKAPKQKKAA